MNDKLKTIILNKIITVMKMNQMMVRYQIVKLLVNILRLSLTKATHSSNQNKTNKHHKMDKIPMNYNRMFQSLNNYIYYTMMNV